MGARIDTAAQALRESASQVAESQAAKQALKDAAKVAKVLSPEEIVKQADKAARKGFAKAAGQVAWEQKGLVASIKGMFSSMGSTLKLSAGIGKPEALAEHLISKKVGIGERLLGKPFRMAAKRPDLALLATGAAAIAVVGTMMHGAAKNRTQAEAMAKVNDLQSPQATATATITTDQDRVTLDDVAAMEARFKGMNGPQAGHLAAQQARSATAQPAQVAAAQL